MRVPKGIRWFAVGLLSLALLAGCSGGSGSGSKAGETITLRFFHKWPEPDHMAYYNAVIQKWEKEHPNIKIEMEAVSDEAYKDKIRVLMAGNNVPDIYFSWAGEFAWKFARAGQALDLTDAFMNSDWKDAVVNSAVQPYVWDGKVYGIPMRINGKFMVYNKKVFNDLGLQPPKTWDEFLEVCETIKQAGIVPIAFGNEFPWAASHYVGDLNAKLVPPEVRQADYLLEADPETLFTDPGYVEALRRFKELNDKGYFNEGPNAIGHDMARSNFLVGNTAMIYVELEEFVTVHEEMGDENVGFFRLPSNPGDRGDPNVLTGAPDGFMIYSKTPHPEEAIAFLKFLVSEENGKEYVRQLGIPSAAVGAVTEETSFPLLEAGLQEVDKASGMALWLDTDINIKVIEVYLPGLQAVLTGSKTPEQVMQEVRDQALKVQQELKAGS
ncbi:MAG: extracellular solute-binding protein [Symbiobacterium sp.]|uniref:ABC transporter substrate-binding protein n=1 Tax=Symbiobacterium sp. TaxID=1971213 RepID=UPI0034644659